MRINRVLSIGLPALSMIMVAVICYGQIKPLSQAAKDGEVIFTIGKKNESNVEFLNWGWTGKEEWARSPEEPS